MDKLPKFNIDFKLLESSQYMASVVISPLKQGFGTTIGNALRRVLLGSIPGAAVFAIKIDGVDHEFMAPEGVLEDVTNIILNVKKLVISIDEKVVDVQSLEEKSISEWPTMKIKKNKAGVVYANDIECPPGMKVINKDLKICELSKDVEFGMELYATLDRGYRSFSENRERLDTLKIISIDSLFSPIVKVEWKVVEEKTTKQGTTDKLHLTLVTNGSVKAADALSLAAHTLISLLEPISAFNPETSKRKLIGEAEVATKKVAMATPIDELELTMRSFNCLKQNGINTITELAEMTRAEAENIKNLGKKSLNEIIAKLAEKGLKFKGS
ncbi:DNA-directed RNA polymerase alpha subunit [Mycoplasma haemofelis str. Langford 1]|uniref:DNA-directed RNA polymerase subunit alpha n=2 Tax=Mycoplasma haemofelis TaxID=29501 RepID=F6FHB0_MYCHI|nr:DNA-directed RNA polymerase subunit alpha [Mycoplasma haemofelis]AEG73740.1 DNA-directed RNA polymerase subunit alpha [Mycoplasma haemofelis Ohio2]CBY93444.1 DNA-directed RNA polymerase alpha subunit [Mycoplasma haemofelis str. Langford 1]